MSNPGNVVVLAKADGTDKFNQREAINRANQRRVTILSNKLFDQRLAFSDVSRSKSIAGPVGTGTIIVYVAPGEKMRGYAHYTDETTGIKYAFKVPKKAVGAKNIALAVNHFVDARGRSLIEYEDKGKNQVLVKSNDESKITIVEAFPAEDGWYLTEKKFGIPVGAAVDIFDKDARHLGRTNEYIGLLVRGNEQGLGGYYDWRNVSAAERPSSLFKVWKNAVPASEPAMR